MTLLCALTLAACTPQIHDTDSLVREPRLIAVRMEPAEVAPRQKLQLRALYAGGEEADIDWAYCNARKPLSELGPIAHACLPAGGSALEVFANGLHADGSMPADACRSFGPDRPAPKAGEPAGRPVDADPTGGYYQPIAVYDYGREAGALFEARIACSLPGATRAQFAQWNQRYLRNQNPRLEALDASRAEEIVAVEPDGEALRVPVGAELELHAYTEACADEVASDQTCGGAEPYLYFDVNQREIITRREVLRISWFASNGEFRDSRTGLDDSDEPHTANGWTAPKQAGEVTLWLVLRDDRGGVSWTSYRLEVFE